ncbi:MAG: ferrochelatase [Actinomycetota bacterium]
MPYSSPQPTHSFSHSTEPRQLNQPKSQALDPYDAVMLLSFGGPEGPDEVLPFLRNVTAGRGIPDERLADVAEHYHHFGGRSPINDQNRALLSSLTAELARRGAPQPVYWGNRNWAPYLTDVLRQAYEAGARRLVVIPTSAYSSYSSCRQYREDLADAMLTLTGEGRGLDVDKIRPYANHPGFARVNAAAALDALRQLPEGSHLAFVTHSIPDAMNAASGPPEATDRYAEQHLALSAWIAQQVSASLGREVPWQLTYCSRSGPSTQPWLEPDIGDHLRRIATQGAPGVGVCPIGFVSDHMEVVYDLDTEARDIADEIDLPMVRAATVGVHPDFVSALVDLAEERASLARGDSPLFAVVTGDPVPVPCPTNCCRNLRTERPAACGVDWMGETA